MNEIWVYQTRKIKGHDRRKRYGFRITRIKDARSIDLITDQVESMFFAELGNSLERLGWITPT
jgi:hypothetical protein